MFIKKFFNQELQISKEIQNKTNLVLYNRLATNVLRYRNPMPLDNAMVYKSFISNYLRHIAFLNNNVSFDDFTLKKDSKPIIQITNEFEQMISNFTLSMVEELLDDEENWDYDVINTLAVYVIKYFEDAILTDNSFYRILSLSLFMNPELFSDKYLKSHIDYIFNFYDEKKLVFTNIQNGAPYLTVKMNEEDLSLALDSIKPQENLDIYNFIRENDDYIVYKCKNIRPRVNYNSLQITKNQLFEVEDIEMLYYVRQNLISFYSFSLELQNNTQNKNITLANLQKLGNLQQESYYNFLIDIDTI
jgi:hypothetical protein